MKQMERIERPKKGRIGLIIIVIVLLTLAAAFLAFSKITKTFMFAEKPRPETTNYTYRLDEIVVNLRDQGRYLKTTIALGYGLQEDLSLIVKREAQIRDTLVNALRSKTVNEVMQADKTDELKSVLMDKVNECFDEKIITDVFITDFLVQ